ncbi:hypothetical protein, partial [Alistipes ihumii]|uniref:hypothetical protein n=1 Tax=Alistipes ihumii TaxID=1470347 RepID=UPI00307B1FC0
SFSRSQPKRSALSGGRLSSTAGGRHLFTFQPAFRIHPILSGISTRETYRPSPPQAQRLKTKKPSLGMQGLDALNKRI